MTEDLSEEQHDSERVSRPNEVRSNMTEDLSE